MNKELGKFLELREREEKRFYCKNLYYKDVKTGEFKEFKLPVIKPLDSYTFTLFTDITAFIEDKIDAKLGFDEDTKFYKKDLEDLAWELENFVLKYDGPLDWEAYEGVYFRWLEELDD